MKRSAPRPYRPHCQICGAELPWHRSLIINSHRVFCSTHAKQYWARQHQGVSTQELDTRWSDTLDNWSERPKALNAECGPRSGSFGYLFFAEQVEPWVLFLRSYNYWAWQRIEFRGPDCLAVNTQTGEAHRFVGVEGDDVLDDLRGIRPAPHQTELAPYWGRRLPPGFFKHLAQPYLEGPRQHRLARLLQVASFPVYGISNQALGFEASSVKAIGLGWHLSNVSFSFTRSLHPRVLETVSIASCDSKLPRRAVSNHLYACLFKRYQFSEVEQVQAGSPVLWEGALTIAQVHFTGELHHWAQPRPLSWFQFTSGATRLIGDALGPSKEEMFHLLEGMVVLNHDADLIAQYQHKLDQERTRLLGVGR